MPRPVHQRTWDELCASNLDYVCLKVNIDGGPPSIVAEAGPLLFPVPSFNYKVSIQFDGLIVSLRARLPFYVLLPALVDAMRGLSRHHTRTSDIANSHEDDYLVKDAIRVMYQHTSGFERAANRAETYKLMPRSFKQFAHIYLWPVHVPNVHKSRWYNFKKHGLDGINSIHGN
ncbi:hypothetical protein BD410DRAFT_830379 [Rickenella mellea]|uniref:Uncharacterized protein n=1 Tax=Rickenella mellea TaxID=50990 RepID=A0A4Y7PVK2_9AGAM|nr:hypothetical protein BD410DRAFT_830379 [Rickenella mellea]